MTTFRIRLDLLHDDPIEGARPDVDLSAGQLLVLDPYTATIDPRAIRERLHTQLDTCIELIDRQARGRRVMPFWPLREGELPQPSATFQRMYEEIRADDWRRRDALWWGDPLSQQPNLNPAQRRWLNNLPGYTAPAPPRGRTSHTDW